MLGSQPIILDLGMSDTEYLQLLAEGRDPIREQAFEAELIRYGISPEEARQLAPLFEKLDCSVEEKIWVNRALRHIWRCLSQLEPNSSTYPKIKILAPY